MSIGGWQTGDEKKRRFEVTLYTTQIGKPGDGVPAMDKLMACRAKALEPFRMCAWRVIDPNDTSDQPPESAKALHDLLGRIAKEAQRIQRDLVGDEFTDPDEIPWMGDLEDMVSDLDDEVSKLYGRIEEAHSVAP